MLKNIISFVFVLLFVSGFTQELGTFTDSRDGYSYKTVTFKLDDDGSGLDRQRIWFAENLRYNANDSHCYRDLEPYCEKFGRLYTYTSALESCPEGWRVPTATDWFELFALYGGIHKAGNIIKEDGESNLNLQYAGFTRPDGHFHGVGIEGYYWDSEEVSAKDSGLIIIHDGTGEIYHGKSGKTTRNATRCIKNHEY